MKPETSAILRIAFLAAFRSHPLRAGVFLAILLSGVSPSLVAFTFAGADQFAMEGALGTACLAAPMLALYAGTFFAAGEDPAEGLQPMLRSPASTWTTVLASSAGLGLAALLALSLSTLAAVAALLGAGIHVPPAVVAAPVAAAAAACFASAAAGLALGTAVPRASAGIFATLIAAVPLAAAATGISVPGGVALLLARDAAFGTLPLPAVGWSVAASLLATGSAAAAAVALLRSKDFAPRPGST